MLTQSERQTIKDVIYAMRIHRDIVVNNRRAKARIGKDDLKDMAEGMDISLDKLNNLIEETEIRYLNYYRCKECKVSWKDEWDSKCNDHCPKCDKEITPHKSVDIR